MQNSTPTFTNPHLPGWWPLQQPSAGAGSQHPTLTGPWCPRYCLASQGDDNLPGLADHASPSAASMWFALFVITEQLSRNLPSGEILLLAFVKVAEGYFPMKTQRFWLPICIVWIHKKRICLVVTCEDQQETKNFRIGEKKTKPF